MAALVERLEALQGPSAPSGGGGSAPAAEAPPPPETESPPVEDEPSRAEAEPAARAAESTTPLGRVWESLLERVRTRKVMLASFLEHGAPHSMDDDHFTAIFDNSYHEGMVGRRENLALIREELTAIVGKELAVRVKAGSVPLGSRPAPSEASREESSPKDLLGDNPGLKRIIQDLGGQLLPGGGEA